jgi:hypothetical protein
MTKHWLAGAAALAMMTGVAYAQGMSSGSSVATQPTTGSNSSGGCDIEHAAGAATGREPRS